VALDQLWKLRLSSFPSQELDHLRYVCMVDDTRARAELGYEPVHSIDRALKDVRKARFQMA
jgi:UDP-glucose 4-epimerase